MANVVNDTKKRYCGIVPPIITPLKESGALDEEGLEKLINYCIDNGVHGIFAMGTSGEAMCVSRKVWKRTIEVTLKTVGNRVPVFCGAIDSSTERVIENIKELEQAGAEIIVATPAFYLQNTCQEEIIRHFEKICSSTSLKIVVYNIPSTTHVNILPETIRRLSEIDNIIAYKDSSADWEQLQREIFLLEDANISLFNGAEELCGVSMLFGAQGCVPGLASFFPRMFVDMYEAALRKDIDRVYELQKQVWDVRKILFVGKSWMSAMKYAGSKFGFGTETVTDPVEPLKDDEKKKIDEILEKYK
ncbi:MAG TPA: dihydrodipicolinate synthase family protein [Clostridiaceae bacterium]|nr:dihydrodipicolinate synthase family protein [Clostridiaceae bacterium]